MSFDRSEIDDLNDYPPYPDEDMSTAGLDDMASPGILPTGEAVMADADDYADMSLTGADTLDTVEGMVEWRPKQVYFIGTTAIDGAHPNPQVQERIDEYCRELAAERQEFLCQLSHMPRLNSSRSRELATCGTAVAEDFGIDITQTPITLLDPIDYKDLRGGVVHEDGIARFGQIVVRVRPGDAHRFGRASFVTDALHEAAHMSGGNPGDAVASVQPFRPGSPDVGDPELADFHVFETGPGHFIKPVALSEPPYGMSVGGEFWEEAFAQEYAIVRRDQLVGPPRASGTLDIAIGLEYGFLTLTDGERELPHYRKDAQRITLPWQYTTNAVGSPSRSYHLRLAPSSIAAYGLHLLDQQVPGLMHDMIAARREPERLDTIRDRINEVEPGMYDRISREPYTSRGFRRGLLRIERALGILNEPTQPPTPGWTDSRQAAA